MKDALKQKRHTLTKPAVPDIKTYLVPGTY